MNHLDQLKNKSIYIQIYLVNVQEVMFSLRAEIILKQLIWLSVKI